LLRRDKEQIVRELVERLRSSDTLIVADYRGLSMSAMDDVRTKLLAHGARFSVVKNTLTRRAAEEAGVKELVGLLDGPCAIAFVEQGDMVAVAKTLSDTARETRMLTIRGGILQGQTMTAEQVRDLAGLPPVEILKGQAIGVIVAPLHAFVGVVSAPLRDLAGIIDARRRQMEDQEG
jgi:large subunit ribosomal protein L10